MRNPKTEPSRIRETDTLLPNLTSQHLALLQLAISVGTNGTTAAQFDDLLKKARDFLVVMRQNFPRVNFGDFTNAVQILSTCGAIGEALTQRRLASLNNCPSLVETLRLPGLHPGYAPWSTSRLIPPSPFRPFLAVL
jgi:hypothetical protein